MMPEQNKKSFSHLNFEDRKIIEEMIGRQSLRSIAQVLGVSPSTVSREVFRNRVRDKSRRYGSGKHRFCANEKDCGVRGLCQGCTHRLCRVCQKVLCTYHCPHYEKAYCQSLSAAPFVCNGCTKKPACFVERWIYNARQAETQARVRLSEERSGFDLCGEEVDEIASLIVPLIRQGQSISQIYLTHAEQIPFSQKSLRTYIHAGVFAELSDFDLKRKVRYRIRKKKSAKLPKDIPNRSYSDFCALPFDMQAAAVELDTVIGRIGGKCLLTLFMRSCSLMPLFLLDACDTDEVYRAFELLAGCVSASEDNWEFGEIFPTLLSDRGSEFADFKDLESFGINLDGVWQTRHYYCDPRHPEQRGGQEKNHTYIREILPKGTSFDHLNQNDACLMASHINSIPRASLGGKSPWELACLLYGRDFLDLLGIDFIAPDDIIRKPFLLT